MSSDLSRRLRALERHAQQSGGLTDAEMIAGVARYNAASSEFQTIARIASPDAFSTMLRQMPPWMGRIFATSVEPMDMLL